MNNTQEPRRAVSSPVQPTYGKYLLIWIWLIALLVAGTFFSGLPIPKNFIVLLILLVSLTKVALVGLFYMHLKFEKIVPVWIVAIFPFFLIGIATLLVYLGTALG